MQLTYKDVGSKSKIGLMRAPLVWPLVQAEGETFCGRSARGSSRSTEKEDLGLLLL